MTSRLQGALVELGCFDTRIDFGGARCREKRVGPCFAVPLGVEVVEREERGLRVRVFTGTVGDDIGNLRVQLSSHPIRQALVRTVARHRLVEREVCVAVTSDEVTESDPRGIVEFDRVVDHGSEEILRSRDAEDGRAT